jgi:hypothetical protein
VPASQPDISDFNRNQTSIGWKVIKMILMEMNILRMLTGGFPQQGK